jgi:DNA-binding winged helix-turn-helix (wHTH) protein
MTSTSPNEAMKAISAKMPYCSVIVLTEQSMNDPGGVGFQDYEGNQARQFDLPLAKTGEQFGASKKQRVALFSEWHPGGQGYAALIPNGQVGHGIGSFCPQQLTLGNLRINLQAHEVHIGSKPVHLTLTEFRLLVALAMNFGEGLDYISLVRKCLGYEAELLEAKGLIKRHICALRRKIEPTPANPRYIINIRGVGYRMAMPQGE